MNPEITKIITEVSNDRRYYEFCKNISKGEGAVTNLVDDLYQECLLILCECDEQIILDLYQKRHLLFYFGKIVINQWNSSSSPFYTNYRKENKEKIRDVEYDLKETLSNQFILEDKLISKIKTTLDNFYWKDKEIFLIYVENNHTLTSLSKELGLSRNTVNDAIQRTKKYLSKELGIPMNKKHIF